MSLPRKVLDFLASLKLAVILLLSLAAILGTATFYESRYDAKTASHLVYGSWWFSLFLFMLGVNVTCAAAVRYPWKKHQFGFVVTHLGIIVILVGSFITRLGGLEGSMALAQGETSNVVLLDNPTMSWQLVTPASKEGKADSKPSTDVQTVPAEFRWRPPTPERPYHVKLAAGVEAVVDQYLHCAVQETNYTPDGPADNPAVQFRLANGRVNVTQWLALADPDKRSASLGPATVRILSASTPQQLAQMLAPPQATPHGSDGWLVFEANGRQHVVPVEGNVNREVAVDDTPYRIKIDRFLPYAIVHDNQLVNRGNDKVNPAVEFTVLDSQGEAEQHIEFARYPEFSTTHHQKRPTKLKVSYTFEDPGTPGHGVDLIIGPQHELHYKIFGGAGKAVQSGDAVEGKQVATGWMDLQLTVLHYYPKAVVHNEFRAVHPPRGKEGPPPAIHVTLQGTDQPGPYWMQQGDMVSAMAGGQVLRLWYHLEEHQLPFQVQLQKFEVGYDPGTRNAATYTSNVHVTDAPKQASFDKVITMNEPMKYGGLTFFQASFNDQDAANPISIFQVARDPGTPVKYTGSILLVCGIAIMFFGKGYSQENRRKRQRAALRAQRQAARLAQPAETVGETVHA
jgi:hypothetical protein